jgi:Holliday junction DNA helicase RuvA
MITRITGRLEELTAQAALLSTPTGLWYEVLVPACESARLSRHLGQEIILHTVHYIEGDPAHGGQTPRLLGFATESDRDFFRLFTTVKGIGNRKALRAMIKPMSEIAGAIAAKDARFLVALPEIGKRTAEQIVAELHGKVDPFVLPGSVSGVQEPADELPEAAKEAVAVLVQLGEKRPDAEALVERVLAVSPEATTPEAIIQQAYRLKGM